MMIIEKKVMFRTSVVAQMNIMKGPEYGEKE